MNLLMSLALIVLLSLGICLQNGADGGYCWKKSYGRGVGTIPGHCEWNQEKQGLLCYKKCQPGYTGVLFVCWQNCPPGFRDDGAFCFKPKPYGRGAGYVIWQKAKCEKNHGSCEKYGLMWYPKCKSGYYAFGCCICSPKCMWGQKDIGISCAKKTYTRATLTANCGSSKEYDFGLCYNKCRDGYYGVGPVCWSKCQGANHVDCGAACASSKQECANKITNAVESTLSMVGNIAETALTLGANVVAKAALKTSIKLAIQKAAKEAAKNLTKEQVKKVLKKKAKELGKKISEKALEEFANSVERAKNGEEFKFDWTTLDVTGISSVVKAFDHGKC